MSLHPASCLSLQSPVHLYGFDSGDSDFVCCENRHSPHRNYGAQQMTTMSVHGAKHPFTAEEQSLIEHALSAYHAPAIRGREESCESLRMRVARP